MNTLWDVMWEAAVQMDGVEAGIAAAGTALESRTATVNGRAFLFLSPKKAYFKLGPSYEAAKQAAQKSASLQPGGGGWTALLWDLPCAVLPETLRLWVRESHDLMATSVPSSLRVGLLDMKPRSDPAAKGRSRRPRERDPR
ncbi:MAG: hypothetical protein ACYDBQ_03580 [Thermoplasmatota archaeon]